MSQQAFAVVAVVSQIAQEPRRHRSVLLIECCVAQNQPRDPGVSIGTVESLISEAGVEADVLLD